MPIQKVYFKLYDATGVSLLYTFSLVQEANYPGTHRKSVEISGQRGKGSIIIDGGEASWDLTIKGLFMIDSSDEGYEELTNDIDAMESAIALNTAYKLRIDKDLYTTYEYNVKRIQPIIYSSSLRTDKQEYEITFKVNCW